MTTLSTSSCSSADIPVLDKDGHGHLVCSFDKLKEMLKRENDLRLSSEVQALYRDRGYDSYVDITTSVQEQVSVEFGFDRKMGIFLLRSAESLYTDPTQLEEIRDISLYRKFNRCIDGLIKEGDRPALLNGAIHYSDPSLATVDLFEYYTSIVDKGDFHNKGSGSLNKEETHLCSVPLVLLAGSYS